MSADGSTPDPAAAGQASPDLAARVAQLIYSLRARGITADTRQAIAVEQLLISLQPRWAEPDFDLAAHLGPIFCRSMEEQRRFREVVAGLELFRGRAIPPVEEEPASPSEPPKPPKKPSWLLSRRTQVAALIVLMIGAIAVFQFWSKSTGPIVGPVGTVTPPDKPPVVVDQPIEPPPQANNTAPAKLLSYRRIMLRQPLAKSSPWSWAWAAVPLVCLAGWSLNRRGQRPRLRRESTELPQIFREVRLPGGPREPLSGLRVRELSRSLRIRQRVAGRELHIDSTITRTIEQGGLPTLVFESLIEPQYLVLLDRTGSNDHFGELSRALLSTLKLGHVDYNAFEFDGNPTYCNVPLSERRPSDQFRFRLTEILYKNPDRPLLILGDGAGFLNPFTEAPPEWFTWVADRPRILVTPASDQVDWTARELKLRRHGFQVIPMTPTGIPEVAAVLTGIESPRRDAQRYALSFEDEPDRCLSIFQPPADFIQRLCGELQDHLGSDGFLWLASLGAYPELHWGLTLRFGASLIADEERWERLLPRMSRLIWLRQGFMPDWLRDALREQLSREDQDRIHRLLMEMLSVGQSQLPQSESKANDAKDVPLRIVIDEPVGRWNRFKAWWQRWRLARKVAIEPRTWKQFWTAWWERCQLSWKVVLEPRTWKQRWIAWWKKPQKPAKPFDAVFLRYLAPQVPSWLAPRVPDWLAPLVPEKLLKQLSPRESWLRGPSLWVALSLCAAAMIGVYYGAETVRARRFQVQAMEVSHGGERVITRHRHQGAVAWNNSYLILDLRGHTEGMLKASFSPDNTRVVTASSDETARVWNAATGAPLGPPLQHGGHVVSASFSPDGTRVVTASDDKTARVWDAATGASVCPPLRHDNQVLSASFSPDGTRIVTASKDKSARVWDAATGVPLGPPLRHEGHVSSASFSPDGKQVVTASLDDTARVWDAATGATVGPPLRHEHGVISASFSPDGTRVVTASLDQTARLWNAATGAPIGPPLRHANWLTSASFSPDGTRVVSASWDRTARVWDAATGATVGPPLRHELGVTCASFSLDGTRVVTACQDGTARVWDLQTEKYDRELPTDSQWIGMSADGQRWAEKAASGEVAVYELGKPEPVFRLNAAHSGSVHRLSEDGKTFVVGQPNRLSIHRIDYPAAILEEYETKVADPIGAVWIPGDQIAIWDALGKMSVMPSPALVTGYFLNEIPVETVEYTQSHNRRTLVFRGLTGPAVLYDTKTLQIARLKLASGRTKGVASSRLGDRHIVWDETGGGLFELKSLAGKKSPMDLSPEVTVAVTATIRSAGFSQNSAVLYVLGEDDQLSFSWLDKTATRVIVEGVKQVVQGDDNTLAVVFTDGSVRLYDAQFGVPLSDPLPTSGKVTLAAFGRPAPPSLAPSQLPMTTAALFQVPVSPSKGDLSKQPKVSPKQSAAPEYDEKGKAADPKRPVVTPESPLEKGADPTQAEPAAAPIPPAPEPDTRQALSLVTEEGNIEVWELNNSGRAVAMILVGDVQGSLDLTPAAKELSTVLTSRFGFEVTFLGSPIKADVLKEWNRLQTELSPSDRFLFVLIGNSEVMNGETQTNNDDLLFQIGGERKDWITGEQITSFLDALPASQVLMIADCAKAGTLIADSSLMPTKSDQTASRLVLSASGTDDYPWRLTGQELQSKLLTPVVQILQESPLRFQSYPELKAPGLPSDLFTAEEGFNRLAPFIASANERIRTDNPNGILQNGKRLKTDGPIVYGPLRGSKHTPGAQFYFPRRRPPPMTPLPVSTKAERPAEKLNEKK